MTNVKGVALMFGLLIAMIIGVSFGSTSPSYNPWIKIEQTNNVLYIKRDSIVYIIENVEKDTIRFEGRSMIGLVNGEKFYCDKYTADELIELANQ